MLIAYGHIARTLIYVIGIAWKYTMSINIYTCIAWLYGHKKYMNIMDSEVHITCMSIIDYARST